MKKVKSILAVILLIGVGCGGGRKTGNESDAFFTVDVTEDYPKKELILQDFMDVEYIALETNREFVCQGIVQDIGKNNIIVKNSVRDGNIFIFDRNGKALRKINRMGQGGEEYTFILGITLDEDNNEIFVNDLYIKKLLVYDLYGKFKRSLKHNEGDTYSEIYNYDNDNLICNNRRQTFLIVSKQDGSLVKEIKIPFEEEKSPALRVSDPTNNMTYSSTPRYPSIIPNRGNWVLITPSSDTVFNYLSNNSMTPLIVRNPSIQSMNTEVFLFPCIITDRYYFMESVKKEFNFETKQGFPSKSLLYDRQEKEIFEFSVSNDDYSNKRHVAMTGMISRDIINDKIIVFWQKIEADHLYEAYENGQLKGKLKEVAANLKEEDNPVIMLVKHKK